MVSRELIHPVGGLRGNISERSEASPVTDVPTEDGTLKIDNERMAKGQQPLMEEHQSPARGRDGGVRGNRTSDCDPSSAAGFRNRSVPFLPARRRRKLLPFSSGMCRYGFGAADHLRLKGHI